MNDDQSEGQSATAEAFMNTPSRGGGTALGTDIQAKIGQHLRAMYDDVVRQGVPDRFMDLLAQLDKAGGKTPEEDGGGRT
ncbi:hypothetical protein MWN33_04450 [Starkeya koreensis]|uniref:Anti-sigma factor NepR domain-containing protein n=1 Tax=Ancylobacter koreensis TaxID=266121 RepID=A0ABT0DJ20_9HYPH|nr:NepR family anti-sigma factor [Ancylobacter koreensis]MCK0207280.1 hypothetical protein [Ancylobacter koreensis]